MRLSLNFCSFGICLFKTFRGPALGAFKNKKASQFDSIGIFGLFLPLVILVLGPSLSQAQSLSADTPSTNAPSGIAPGSMVTGLSPSAANPTSGKTEAPASDSNLNSKPSSPIAKPVSSSPKWTDLTGKQQFALRPLIELWPEMSETQKRKWLTLCANFSELNAKDQEKLQARMSQWSVLSPQQRAQARVIFAQVQQFEGDERLNKWQQYQALAPEKRNELAQNLNVMPNSAAISPKPKALGTSNTLAYQSALQPSHLRLQADQVGTKTLLPPRRNNPAP